MNTVGICDHRFLDFRLPIYDCARLWKVAVRRQVATDLRVSMCCRKEQEKRSGISGEDSSPTAGVGSNRKKV